MPLGYERSVKSFGYPALTRLMTGTAPAVAFLGAVCAGEIISHFGARSATSLAALVQTKLGIKVC